MKRLLKIYMERPELVALVVLVVMVVYFTIQSKGLFVSYQNLRGIMSLFPELAIMALGLVRGDEVEIATEAPDGGPAVDAIAELAESGFGEH